MDDHPGGWSGAPDDRPTCERCGRPLGQDPDDDPYGGATGPLCGECARERDFEADLSYLDARDGSLDGIVEW